MSNPKYNALIKYLKEKQKIAVAFSGGVDSAFLLAASKEAIGDKVLAVTVKTSYIPDFEIEDAKAFVNALNIRHKIIKLPIPPEIIQNPPDRCYLCKTKIFTSIKEIAAAEGISIVADGSNKDDLSDYRPGMKALRELDVISPLLECGITKQEIRKYSQDLNLPTWDKPALACLLTRIPYNTTIDIESLKRIAHAENYIRSEGLALVRVRDHGNIARIETSPDEMRRLLLTGIHEKIVRNLKNIGYEYITLDLEGYRTGSFNETLHPMNQ